MKALLSLILIMSIVGAVMVVVKLIMAAFTVVLGVLGMVFILSQLRK